MDGIELIKQLKQEHIPSRIIVMSAYDDFQFVKQSMRDGADDYLLKLELNTQQLKDALTRISSKMEEIPPYFRGTSDISLENDCRKFLQESLYQKSQSFPQKFPDSFALEFSTAIPFFGLKIEFQLKDAIFDDFPEQLSQPIYDMLLKSVRNFGKGYIFEETANRFFVFFQPLTSTLPYSSVVKQLVQSIDKMSNMLFNFECYIGGTLPQPTPVPYELYSKAEVALNRAYFCKERLSFSADEPPEDSQSSLFNEELVQIESALRTSDGSNVGIAFQQIEQKISNSEYLGKEYLDGLCYTLMYLSSQISLQQDRQIDSSNFVTKLKRLKNRSQYIKWIEEFQKAMIVSINPDSENQRIILSAKKCIHQNYQNNISLDFVADYLCLSPNYFSKIFKKYTGQGFVDYLTDIRIKHATELLQSGKYMVYEVAGMVGYDNSSYFSQIFKKKTGISPYKVKSII